MVLFLYEWVFGLARVGGVAWRLLIWLWNNVTRAFARPASSMPYGGAPRQNRPRLVLFIHGIGGSPEGTFGEFPQLLRTDPKIAREYDVQTFGYSTSFYAKDQAPDLSDVARDLKAAIEYRFSGYSEIVILAHSQGGLITRRYIADTLKAGVPLKVSRVIYFATPHMGALAAKLGTMVENAIGVTLLGDQTTALTYDSRFLQGLLLDEAATGTTQRIWTKFVLATDDKLVGKTSAWGVGLPGDFVQVPGVGHKTLVKPDSRNHPSYQIVRSALLEVNARQPWEAETDHRQPNLKLRTGFYQTDSDRHRNRFKYWSRTLPFIGRESEERELAEFLADATQRFRWLLVSGAGGTGKSRLALELILAQASGWWNAGFLDPRGASVPDWETWQPRLPTLMIVDYAGREPTVVAAMLKGLAEREVPHLLRHPIRVLLVDNH